MRSKIGPLDEGDHQPAYDVKRPVPHNGPWFLILDLYRCQTSRDVEVNLYKITPSGTLSTFVSGLGGVNFGQTGMGFDAAGNLYVARNNLNYYSKFTPSGTQTNVTMSSANLNPVS